MIKIFNKFECEPFTNKIQSLVESSHNTPGKRNESNSKMYLAKINEVPKIPPLVKPPNRGNRLPDIIAKAKEMVGPKDKKKVDSDDDRSSVGSVNGKLSELNPAIWGCFVQE